MPEDWKVIKRGNGFAVYSPEGTPVANCKNLTDVGTEVWIGNLIRRDIKGNVTYADVDTEPIPTPVHILSARIRYDADVKARKDRAKKEKERIARKERRNRAQA